MDPTKTIIKQVLNLTSLTLEANLQDWESQSTWEIFGKLTYQAKIKIWLRFVCLIMTIALFGFYILKFKKFWLRGESQTTLNVILQAFWISFFSFTIAFIAIRILITLKVITDGGYYIFLDFSWTISDYCLKTIILLLDVAWTNALDVLYAGLLRKTKTIKFVLILLLILATVQSALCFARDLFVELELIEKPQTLLYDYFDALTWFFGALSVLYCGKLFMNRIGEFLGGIVYEFMKKTIICLFIAQVTNCIYLLWYSLYLADIFNDIFGLPTLLIIVFIGNILYLVLTILVLANFHFLINDQMLVDMTQRKGSSSRPQTVQSQDPLSEHLEPRYRPY